MKGPTPGEQRNYMVVTQLRFEGCISASIRGIHLKINIQQFIYWYSHIAVLNTVLLSVGKKKIVGGLFCDLQKAFDCVNHDVLLAKLEFYGISGTANKLLRSYIKNRY